MTSIIIPAQAFMVEKEQGQTKDGIEMVGITSMIKCKTITL
jgi:hypothetical protein